MTTAIAFLFSGTLAKQRITLFTVTWHVIIFIHDFKHAIQPQISELTSKGACTFYIDRYADAFFKKQSTATCCRRTCAANHPWYNKNAWKRFFAKKKKEKKTWAALCSFINAQEAKREENHSPMARVCPLFSLTLSTSLCAFQNWTKVLVSKETVEPRKTLCYLSTKSWQLTNKRMFLMRLSVYWTWISS